MNEDGAEGTPASTPETSPDSAETSADATETSVQATDPDAATDEDAATDQRAATDRPARHRRIERHPTTGPFNSLRHWPDAKHPLRLTLNFLVVWVVRYSPSLRLKNWLLRRLGAQIGTGVTFALTATPDVFWPELVTVRSHAIVGYDATLLCHEFLQDEYRTGEIVVGERAMIGAGAIVLPGVEIGAGAQVGANSVVTRDVPPETTVAGVPAEPVDG